MSDDSQTDVCAFLAAADSYPHQVDQVVHYETHISHVYLAGEFAYKLKKARQFDFLDFSTLEKRKHFCEEEVRLNSRFAPDLYLGVLAISRLGKQLVFGLGDETLDFVVQMRRFDEGMLFSDLAERGELKESLLLEISDIIARFHRTAVRMPNYWGPQYVEKSIEDNLRACAAFCPLHFDVKKVECLREATLAEFSQRKTLILRRQKTHVRAVHGDLHLRNMCVFRGRATLFDGIEFNAELANCDVWADFAFFIMDLLFRGRREDAAFVWNHYLQETDDFEGLELLRLYVSYRATVRAKVNCLSSHPENGQAKPQQTLNDAVNYLALAQTILDGRASMLIAVGGLSGSGKSTMSSMLAKRLSAVHIRSDAVRKHLLGIDVHQRASASAYSAEVTRQTYAGLLQRAALVVGSGYPAIVDAVFHTAESRAEITAMADKLGVKFVGIWCSASPKVSAERIRLRVGDISDADESVLSLQGSYDLGDISWHQLDTSERNEIDTAQDAWQIVMQ